MASVLTKLIQSAPDDGADIGELWAAAYEELKQLARAKLRVSGQHTLLDTTGLVNDAYMRLAKNRRLQVESRAHFLAYSARVMRSVIVDLVRAQNAERRGSGLPLVTLNTAIAESVADDEPVRVDEALTELGQHEPRLVQVVEMRYFGGFSEAEIAELLGVTIRTVQRDWAKARLLLRSMLSPSET
jgi:RNA polymerase sigma factor (TIGR02999 family)